ncbi:MAG: hypothetical protein EBR51_00240 [Gammaproteobacteria bacterium]|jgi:hypothetical protein|nr:hypothetical protein [Gammaproteobacteria bacterium]
MILIWDSAADECAYTMQCQLKFYLNQCYNPFAHEHEELHSKVLPCWWAEVMVRSFDAAHHQTRWVGATLHRHYAYAFGPHCIFHRRRLVAVYSAPERIPVLILPIAPDERKEQKRPRCRIMKAQRWACKIMQEQHRSRWLAAVRVILLRCFDGNEDVLDKIILKQLYDWDLAQYTLKQSDAPESLSDNSFYLMEEAVERALHGASISYV